MEGKICQNWEADYENLNVKFEPNLSLTHKKWSKTGRTRVLRSCLVQTDLSSSSCDPLGQLGFWYCWTEVSSNAQAARDTKQSVCFRYLDDSLSCCLSKRRDRCSRSFTFDREPRETGTTGSHVFVYKCVYLSLYGD